MSRVLPYNAKQWEIPALLDGRKTVTRRVVKPPYFVEGDENDKRSLITCRTAAPSSKLYKKIGSMPYPDSAFGIADILYVRETWCEESGHYYYRTDFDSDYLDPCETLSGGYPHECTHNPGCVGCTRKSRRIMWRPSIHMPRAAARIWLRVTDVRVEQLQDITEEQVKAEGITEEWAMDWWHPTYNDPDSGGYPIYVDTFADLWDSTIQKPVLARYGWEANPWVWAIEFERCEKPEGV